MKDINGFYITITQLLDYRATATRKLLSFTKPEIWSYPKMAYSLKITFNDLKVFNINLEKLKRKPHCNNRDNINIMIEGNKLEKI